MKKLSTLLILTICLLCAPITAQASANQDWNVSGTYYDRIYLNDPGNSTRGSGASAMRTYGTCTLYVTKGKQWGIYIDPRFGSGTGYKAVVTDSTGHIQYCDTASGYKGSNGWYPDPMDYFRVPGERYSIAQPYDGKPRTVWCFITTSAYMNYYYDGKWDLNTLRDRSNVRVTINVRQNPSEQRPLGGDETL